MIAKRLVWKVRLSISLDILIEPVWNPGFAKFTVQDQFALENGVNLLLWYRR